MKTSMATDKNLFNLYRNLKPGDRITVKVRQPSYRNSEQCNCSNVPDVFLEPEAIAEVISVRVSCVRSSKDYYLNKFVHVYFDNPDDPSNTSKHSAGVRYQDIVLVKDQ